MPTTFRFSCTSALATVLMATTGCKTNGPDAASGGEDASLSGQCTPTTSTAAARAALATGATSVPVDCAGNLIYSRTLDTSGNVLTEQILTRDTGARSIWDFSKPTRTYRHFPSASATSPSETLDVTLGASDADAGADAAADPGVDAGVDAEMDADAEAGADAGGLSATFVSATDTNGDLVPDTRITYVVNLASPDMPFTIESDPQETGSWTVTATGTDPRVQPNVNVVTGNGQCSQAQAAALTQAYNQAYDQGTSCLEGLDPGLAHRFYEAVVRSPNAPTIHCGASSTTGSTPCAESDLGGTLGFWFPSLFQPNQITITLYPNELNGSPSCGGYSLASAIFHELSHYAFGPHPVGDGQSDPGDRVYGCQRTCFPVETAQGSNTPPSSLTCAACLGTTNGDDPRCNKYPTALCPYTQPGWCPPPHHGDPPYGSGWYTSAEVCAIECQDLFDFISYCQPVTGGPCQYPGG